MNYKTPLTLGATFAGLGVAFGAFGAHALKDLLTASGRIETYELAVKYQFYHAFALLITGLLMKSDHTVKLGGAAICFSLGVAFFSGSLYVLCFTGIKFLGAITPIGGALFIAGWVIFLLRFLKTGDTKKAA